MLTPVKDSNSNSTVIIISAVLFLIFDAAVLGLSYWIAHQIDSDAVAINLAGRQRMLTQRMSKGILQYDVSLNSNLEPTEAMRAELKQSADLFDETLNAFSGGGEVEAADGRILLQSAVNHEGGQPLVDRARKEWLPLKEAIFQLLNAEQTALRTSVDNAVVVANRVNLPLLDYSNRITNHIENTSRQRTRDLRLLQVMAFVLALLNFAVLVNSLWRRIYILHGSHEKLREHAETDSLTGLPNRRSLMTRLENAIAEIEFRHTRLVVCFLDLNDFKPVNDHYGHEKGDVVLQEIAARLQRSLRQSDMIARHGGDEFVVLLENTGSYDQVCLLLDNLVRSLEKPLTIDGRNVIEVGISIGAVVVDTADTTPDSILHLADKLMYRAKDTSDSHWLLAKLVADRNELMDINAKVA